jgi:transaldolase
LTISPGLLTELQNTVAALPRKLDPAKTASLSIEKISVDKATFDKMHAADRMASDKLAEGIDGFTKALITLEQLLAERLARLESEMVAAG